MNLKQLSLVVVLGFTSSVPAYAAGPSEQGGGWRSSSEQPASSNSNLSGTLYRNSADQNGLAPYIVLDRWGVVRGYVAAAQGVELESRVGQQVSLQGTIKTLPGGDMPYLTCQQVLGDRAEGTRAPVQHASAPSRRESFAPAVQDKRRQENARQSDLPVRSDMAAEPAPRINPRRGRGLSVEGTNYQETLPAPVPSGELHRSPTATDPALAPVPIEEGPMVTEGPAVVEGRAVIEPGRGHAGCDSCAGGACEAGCDACCNDVCEEPCWGPRRPLYCWGPTGIWVKADYLQWWQSGTHVPALATTGPNADNAGKINADGSPEPGTGVLFGNDYINNKSVGGGRIQAGMWLNPCATIGFEGEFFALGDENTNYYQWSDGKPIISRPFFDVNPAFNSPAVENVAFPRGNPLSCDGAINISAMTRFHGAGAHFLFTTCREEGCWTDDCGCCSTTYHDRFRADFVAGYRYLDLEDQLGITETITTTGADTTATSYLSAFLVNDQFSTQNTFNGGDLGMKFAFERNRWSLDLFPRIAIGTTHSTVNITGSTRVTDQYGNQYWPLLSNPTNNQPAQNGGLLALKGTNIGQYSQDTFAVVPELDANLGFQVTRHARLVIGYSGLYWSSVVRAGEQIDTRVNSSYLPAAAAAGVTPTGPARPQFAFQNTGFWAQGVNLGLDCRW